MAPPRRDAMRDARLVRCAQHKRCEKRIHNEAWYEPLQKDAPEHFLLGGKQHTQKHCIHPVQASSLLLLFFSLSLLILPNLSLELFKPCLFSLSSSAVFREPMFILYNKPEQYSKHKSFTFFCRKTTSLQSLFFSSTFVITNFFSFFTSFELLLVIFLECG